MINYKVPITKIGDPYILRYKDKYYMYATSGFNGYHCWISDDLKIWSDPVICYKASEKSFGNDMFWAPEVYEFNNKFYMYYTAHWKKFKTENLRIGVAVADNPEGPFNDVQEKPMFDLGYGVLDAHILKDEKDNYIYYSRAGENNIKDGIKEANIHVAKLGDDYVSIKSEHKLILFPEEEWETKNPEIKQVWNEGPFVVKHNNKYHLMYSANYYKTKNYCIGAAFSDNPMGPFIKYNNNPILVANGKLSGPGHNSVVKGKDGKYYCIFHAHTDINNPGSDRQVYISELIFENEKIKILS